MASRLAHGAAFAMLSGIWGSTWLVIRFGVGEVPPFLSAALRFVLAFAVLLPILLWRRSRLPRGRAEWGLVAFVGVAMFTLDYGLIYWGEANGVKSGLSAILFATYVLQTAVFAHVLLRSERLTLQKLAGIGIGFAGILLIFRGELGAGPGLLVPMLAIVASATCAGIASVATKRWGQDTDTVSFTALSMGIGAVGLGLISLAAGEPWSAPPWPGGVLPIVYLAIAGSAATFLTYWWLLKQIEATTASYIAMVTPVVALILGFAAGEAFDGIAIAGAGVTLGGIYLAVSRRLAALASGRAAAAAPVDPPAR